MTRTIYTTRAASLNLYVKPTPRTDAAFASDVTVMTPNANDGRLYSASVGDGAYELFLRAGIEPEATDRVVGTYDADIATSVWNHVLTGASSAATIVLAIGSGVATLLERIIGTLASGTHNPQTGDSFARLGAPAGASIAADIAAIDGGTIDTDQLVEDILEGLSTLSIEQVGPEYDPDTRTITLISGDDYLVANSAAVTFNITVPGVDLTTANAVFSAMGNNLPVLAGTATLVDAATDTPKLRLEWTRAQTKAKKPGRYMWGVAIVDTNGKVKTFVKGPLILQDNLVDDTVVDAAVTAAEAD